MIYDAVKHLKHYLLSDGIEVKDHINSIVGDMLGRSAWKAANVIKHMVSDELAGYEYVIERRNRKYELIEE